MTKSASGVAIDLSSLSPKAARKQLEEVSGPRLRRWIMSAEVSFTEVARCLGMQRTELYDVMEGVRSFRFAWFPLLPEPVRRVALTELALEAGCELTPVAESGESRDVVRAIHESLDVVRTGTEALADGAIDATEARQIMSELDELNEAVAAARAHLRSVIGRHEAAMQRRLQ